MREEGRGIARAPAGEFGAALEPEELVERALAEDVGDGDRTTLWTVSAAARGTARIVAREAGVLAGLEPTGLVFGRVSPHVAIEWETEEGEVVESGSEVARIRGPVRALLTAERTALNFLSRLSGIATLARRFVRAVEGTGVVIVDTRKTTPGWRALEKAATAAGGVENHRFGLYDMVLVKENHVRAAGGLGAALRRVRERARAEGTPVEVEVADPDELEEALGDPPDRILLDNMTPQQLRRAVERVRARGAPRPVLEASGGVTLANVRSVAETGVDLISVGALTHSAPALDLSLLLEEE